MIRKPAQCWLGALAIAGLATAAYWPTLHNGFVWDDDAFLTENPLIRAADGLRRFWLTTQAPDYWPLTSSSLWVEWRLWGMHAAGYHVSNLILHVAESLLVWRLLRQLKAPGAFLGGLIFAVHPVNVESVAWIAQRKNLVGMLFYLISLLAFIRGLNAEPRRRPLPRMNRWYAFSLTAFALALLGKGSVATLPLVLAGILWWRREFSRGSLARLAPFLAVACGFAAMNVWFEIHRAGAVTPRLGPAEHLLVAASIGWFYLLKAFVPWHLTFIYPLWHVDAGRLTWWIPLGGALSVTLVLAGAVRRRSDRSGVCRGLLAAWLYYWTALLPVLGFAGVYFMRYSFVADHYQHLALIAVAAVAGAALSRIAAGSRFGWIVPVSAVGILAAITFRHSEQYRDSETLYRATLRTNPSAWVAQANLGNILANSGRLDEAARHFQLALEARPDDAEAQSDYGAVLARMGRLDEAIVHYRSAVRIDPALAQAELNWGLALRDLHRDTEALAHLEAAAQLAPAVAETQTALGTALLALGRNREAADRFVASLRIDPGSAAGHCDLGDALRALGRPAEGLAEEEAALRLAPSYPPAWLGRGLCLYDMGRTFEAAECYRQAIKWEPGYPDALNDLGCALLRMNQVPQAIDLFEAALRSPAVLPDLPYNLGVALARAGRLDEAAAQFRRALELQPGNNDARFKLAAVLWRQGKKREAIAQQSEAMRRSGNDAPSVHLPSTSILRQ